MEKAVRSGAESFPKAAAGAAGRPLLRRQSPSMGAAPLTQMASDINQSPLVRTQVQFANYIAQSPQVQTQLKLRTDIGNSSHVQAQLRLADHIQGSPSAMVQRKRMEEIHSVPVQAKKLEKKLPAQTKSKLDEKSVQAKGLKKEKLVQRKSLDEKKLTQRMFDPASTPAQLEEASAATANRTGLPDQLKSGVESLSGMSLDDVRVHYSSPKPAQLNALAYAQGTDIHVAPGQERHLPHEAWHIVQQKQGRVRPTMQMKIGIPVNDDAGLEKEADVMGSRALQQRKDETHG